MTSAPTRGITTMAVSTGKPADTGGLTIASISS